MARTPTGYVFQDKRTGSWYARITFTRERGKRRNVKRRVKDRRAGERTLKKLARTYEDDGATAFDVEKLTFNYLCDCYEQHYAIPAQYVKGRKVAGLRSVASVKGYIKVFRQHFDRRLLKSVTYEDLRAAYRTNRLKTGTHQSKQRSLTTVNREMAYLRRLPNIAERNGWIARNPFKLGDVVNTFGG